MPRKSGCFIPRPAMRGARIVCSGAALIAALSGPAAIAASAPRTSLSAMQAAADAELSQSRAIPVQAQGEPADFRAADISGLPGQAIPVRIDVLAGTDGEDGKLFIFTGLPEGVKMSPGGNFGEFWAVNASVVKDLTLTAPDNFSGSFTVWITRSRDRNHAAKSASITVTIGQSRTTPTSAAAPIAPERPSKPAAEGRNRSANEQMLLTRANESFRKGDVSGARVIFEYLAMQGSAAAAMAMGETYDPLVLNKLVVKGLEPDPKKAQQWYEKADKLGNGEARDRLNALAVR